ncbi:hypothetical protein WBG83_09630 [Paenibacillus sp. y28]
MSSTDDDALLPVRRGAAVRASWQLCAPPSCAACSRMAEAPADADKIV